MEALHENPEGSFRLDPAARRIRVVAIAQVDLSWNDCVIGLEGTADVNKAFDCAIAGNRNYSLLLQFKSPVSVPDFVAATAELDIGPYGAPLAPFWHYESGGCNALGFRLLSEISTSCSGGGYRSPWQGAAGQVVAISCYSPDYKQPGRGHFILSMTRPSGHPVEPGENYFAMELRFNNHFRTACGGCTQQKVLRLEGIRLESNDGSPAIDLSGADKATDCATINNAAPICIDGPSNPTFQPPCGHTPATRRTWGMLKGLYR